MLELNKCVIDDAVEMVEGSSSLVVLVIFVDLYCGGSFCEYVTVYGRPMPQLRLGESVGAAFATKRKSMTDTNVNNNSIHASS